MLGVAPAASQEDIKTAFRRLALQLSPDLAPGDVVVDQRFQAVIKAYETLRHPLYRAVYDADLARQARRRRRGFRLRAAMVATAFTLALLLVPASIVWQEVSENFCPPPPDQITEAGPPPGNGAARAAVATDDPTAISRDIVNAAAAEAEHPMASASQDQGPPSAANDFGDARPIVP